MIHNWTQYLQAMVLTMLRLSGLIAFGPLFSSTAIAPRIKAGFVTAFAILLAPVVLTAPNADAYLSMSSVLGEIGVGLTFGLCLMLIVESVAFAGTLLNMEFSFSLVNLLDPNSMIETPVMGELLSWVVWLVLIGTGLDRSFISAIIRSFRVVPVGHAIMQAKSGLGLAFAVSGIFLSGLQLAAPVIAAAIVVEVTVALMGKISPQLPVMVVGIPLKTMVSYSVLLVSLTLWPGWIERHFSILLDIAQKLVT